MTVERVRVTFRAHVREQVLSVTRDLTVERGWERVRVAEIASIVGVSRPTIYKEFGDKRGLGDALVLDEAERFLDGVRSVLTVYDGDPGGAIEASVRHTLDEATASPLLKAVLTSHPAAGSGSPAGDSGFLPLLSTSSSLLQVASDALTEWLGEQLPGRSAADIADGVDALVRLTVSHLVLPAGTSSSETGTRISEVALRYLGLRAAGGRPGATQ